MNQSFLLASLLALAVSPTLSVAADSMGSMGHMKDHGSMSMPMGQTQPDATALHDATGKVVEKSDRQITLAHGPVESLNWPAMTMAFDLAKPELARCAAKGSMVDIRFSADGGRYVIQQLACK